MKTASFEVEVDVGDLRAFAALSGDENPLHVDLEHAKRTRFGRQVLHGAYSAGLISRLAGMQLPGSGCLLHAMKLGFVAPIFPPARLLVAGRQVSGTDSAGRVEVTISDARSGRAYVEAGYDFSSVDEADGGTATPSPKDVAPESGSESCILVSGASGGLGSALIERLGNRALGWSRSGREGAMRAASAGEIDDMIGAKAISAIVHCAWPAPDNRALLEVGAASNAVSHHVAEPIAEIVALAQLLDRRGTKDAIIVLVGSTFAEPGRHAFRTPLYSIAKSTIPTIAKILALELGAGGKRAAAVVFDVLDGGMNSAMSKSTRIAHADRLPGGVLPNPSEAAEQIAWVLENRGRLLSGATIALTGGAIP